MLPVTVAFQLLVSVVPSVYDQLMVQPLIALVPLLVMRTAPVKPVFHSLLTTYWHLAPLAILLDDELLTEELLVATELELVATELELLDLGVDEEDVDVDDEELTQ